jgi:quinoprotein dehydrogenase-associated probable ABC transporter substrate-binding protein/PQQ-dependent catabolism-associated CXXCW motif protein
MTGRRGAPTLLSAAAAALLLLAAAAGTGRAATMAVTGELVDRSAFRVCADPDYLPYSNDLGEGFENRIAELFASELGVPVVYRWYPHSMGFVRRTLSARECDVIMGVVTGAGQVQNTNPYYRSTYVMVRRAADAAKYPDIDAPAVREARIGVVGGTPPSSLLQRMDLLDDAHSYELIVDPRYNNQGEAMMADLAAGRIDIGLIWGPLGGWWAARQAVPLEMVPLVDDPAAGLRMAYRISLGIRPNEPDWKHELEALIRKLQPQIDAVLSSYHVPLLDSRGQLIDPATLEGEAGPAAGTVAEPEGYRLENYRAPVPATLRGATVLTSPAEVEALMRSGEKPVLLDVLPLQPRPADRPEGSVWVEPTHDTIPGSVWLPNVGFGYVPEDTLRYFEESLDKLAGGDKAKALVFYCDPDCWMSWNAAKRAVEEFGYTNVYWYPGGAKGWIDDGRFAVEAKVFDPERAGIVR